MFKLKCYGEINGKDITLVHGKIYKIKYVNFPNEEVEDNLVYLSYKDDSLIFRHIGSNHNSQYPILFGNIQFIEEVDE